ncbi:hydroxyisourate hydrolase [Acinetobacter sp. MD2(2019)]|uniref:hydroxyisourate hydrolase n=1 Tax=Acinetobacter sp. MD2(2019) TaxID=2605273 RepID=UPI002D1F2E21|nr:hydroxyisourate hydrolase [Acinetobacter sp. MD2(2019)]MEB3754085.1 hydroxyisourate hydrolase [Acinetobacter sp. MD2(2019)]
MYKLTVFGLAFCASSALFAQQPIVVKVTNLGNGQPVNDLNITLEAQQNNQWVKIGEGQTDAQGQINTLYPKDKTTLDKGFYRVTLKTSDWFRKSNQRSFYAEVPVVFVIDGSSDHYTLPIQISPYGYSTYYAN